MAAVVGKESHAITKTAKAVHQVTQSQAARILVWLRSVGVDN